MFDAIKKIKINMSNEKEIAHINGRYLMIGAFVALIGTFVTIYFSSQNLDKASETKGEIPLAEKENLKDSANQKNARLTPKQTMDRPPSSLQENQKPIKNQIKTDSEVVITLRDEVSKEPISDAVFSFDNYPTQIKTDRYGRIIIPNKIIEKFGNYNSVRATIKKEGYQTEETNVAFSESHSLFLNKIK